MSLELTLLREEFPILIMFARKKFTNAKPLYESYNIAYIIWYMIYDDFKIRNRHWKHYWLTEACNDCILAYNDWILALFGVERPDCSSYIVFSKLVYAEVSKTTSASKRVFHQTVHAQNSMLTKEIHDQGKLNKFFGANLFGHTIYRWLVTTGHT